MGDADGVGGWVDGGDFVGSPGDRITLPTDKVARTEGVDVNRLSVRLRIFGAGGGDASRASGFEL